MWQNNDLTCSARTTVVFDGIVIRNIDAELMGFLIFPLRAVDIGLESYILFLIFFLEMNIPLLGKL